MPLCEQLLSLYENPLAVVARRDAKEAEIPSINGLSSRSPQTAKTIELVQAIDAQLNAELPRFHAASTRFYEAIMNQVAKIQQDAYFDLRTLLRYYEKLVQTLPLATPSLSEVVHRIQSFSFVDQPLSSFHQTRSSSAASSTKLQKWAPIQSDPRHSSHPSKDRLGSHHPARLHPQEVGIAMTTSVPVMVTPPLY